MQFTKEMQKKGKRDLHPVFVFPGVLGESVLAAQHVIVQIGYLTFTVWIIHNYYFFKDNT